MAAEHVARINARDAMPGDTPVMAAAVVQQGPQAANVTKCFSRSCAARRSSGFVRRQSMMRSAAIHGAAGGNPWCGRRESMVRPAAVWMAASRFAHSASASRPCPALPGPRGGRVGGRSGRRGSVSGQVASHGGSKPGPDGIGGPDSDSRQHRAVVAVADRGRGLCGTRAVPAPQRATSATPSSQRRGPVYKAFRKNQFQPVIEEITDVL